MRINANGIAFNYRIDGKTGTPWLVFSNSLATNLSMWDEQVAALQEDFQILRYDQRGHGTTDAPSGSYTFDLLVEDARALLDALEIEQTHFVGISMGGMTALGLAARYPQRLSSVVICDAQERSTPATKTAWEERIAVAQAGGMDALVEPTVRRWFHPYTLATELPVLDRVRQMIRTTPLEGFIGCAHALQHFDFSAALPQIALPTLFIVGAQDGVLPETMRATQHEVRDSLLIELEQAGHLSNLEQPAAFNQALRDFLSGRALASSHNREL